MIADRLKRTTCPHCERRGHTVEVLVSATAIWCPRCQHEWDVAVGGSTCTACGGLAALRSTARGLLCLSCFLWPKRRA